LDAVIVTGDIAQEPTLDTYHRFIELLRPLGVPVCCTPGNHDRRDLFYNTITQSDICSSKPLQLERWSIISVDSVVDGADHGSVTPNTLARLEQDLQRYANRPTLVITHHHPLPCGSPWLDDKGLNNAQRLLDTLAKHPQVRVLCYGHIHQLKRDRIGEIELIAGPSTCLQFEPESWRQSFSDFRPAYNLLRLDDVGTVDCTVHRIEPDPTDQAWDQRKLA
jgi:Icc protein